MRPRIIRISKSSLSYLSNTFMTLSLQMCHLVTTLEAIDTFGKVGGREARLNANFSTLIASSRAEVGYVSRKVSRKTTHIYSHEPPSSNLKQAGVNAREKAPVNLLCIISLIIRGSRRIALYNY